MLRPWFQVGVELHQGGQPWLSFVQDVGKTDERETGESGEVLAGSADGRSGFTKLGLKDMPEYCCEESLVSVFLTRMDGKVVTIVDACIAPPEWNEFMDYGQDVYFGRSQIEGSQDGTGARYTIGFTITVRTQAYGRFNDFDDYDSDYESEDDEMVPIGATVQFIDELEIYEALGGLDEFNYEKDTIITSAPELLQLLERPCSAHRWK